MQLRTNHRAAVLPDVAKAVAIIYGLDRLNTITGQEAGAWGPR
jgi:hypothetical protein